MIGEIMLFIEKSYQFEPVNVGPDVIVNRDVAYMAGERHTLDIYTPKKVTKKARPVIIDIYGGGLYFGQKSSRKLQNSLNFLSSNYVVISPDYSLIWQAPFPTQIYEIKAVIRWVRHHAVELGINPEQIILSGESSGAHLAMLSAVTASQGKMRNVLFGLYPNISEEVTAVIASYGPYEFDTLAPQFKVLGIKPKYQETGKANSFEGQLFGQQAPETRPDLVLKYNPTTYFNPQMPPMLVLAGMADAVVPILQSQNLVVAASKYLSSDQLAWHWVKDGNHGPADFASEAIYQIKLTKLTQWLN